MALFTRSTRLSWLTSGASAPYDIRGRTLQPSFHFKLPFVDIVDKMQVTLQTLHIPAFGVLTVDNQRVSIEGNFNYTIPKDQFYHLMYEVGRSGNIDINDQVIAVAKDSNRQNFAAQNMVAVNANREAIQGQTEKNGNYNVDVPSRAPT